MSEAQRYARLVQLRQKWLRTWDKVSERVLDLPEWMQTILLDDINTTVSNRIAVMELIHNAQTNS
ncbi:MAG: hypothetical protein NWE95_06010 [Candidatus Bathyarchaeota archaeon]|nr:hypothetical protein [Candidatus Bathyarchaeota archaeon]